MEHHISERFEDRIEEMLDHPERDPHGPPIPARDGTVDDLPTRSLADLTEGNAAPSITSPTRTASGSIY